MLHYEDIHPRLRCSVEKLRTQISCIAAVMTARNCSLRLFPAHQTGTRGPSGIDGNVRPTPGLLGHLRRAGGVSEARAVQGYAGWKTLSGILTLGARTCGGV